MHSNLHVEIPETGQILCPGTRIKLHRFETTVWLVQYGWYSYGGNREMLGWFLVNINDPANIKPLFRTDLYDCYAIDY